MGGDQVLKLSERYEEIQVSHLAEKDIWMMATIAANSYKAVERVPVDICAVIDRSGSMQGERLSMVKETLYHIIEMLDHPKDRFSLVTFESDVAVDIPLMNCKKNAELLCKTVEAIKTGGSTALCDGLVKGVEVLKNRDVKSPNFNPVSSVLLFTDGEANIGYVAKEDVVRAITEPSFYQKQSTAASGRLNSMIATNLPLAATATTTTTRKVAIPCTINAFGYGQSSEPELLATVAKTFGGVYESVANKNDISEIFAKCMAGIISTVAQNIKITFSAVGDAKITQIMTTYPLTEVNKQQEFIVNLGDLQSEENRDILIKVAVPTGQQSHLVDIKIDYDDVTGNYSQASQSSQSTSEGKFIITRPDVVDASIPIPKEIDMQRNRMITVRAMESAADLASSKNFDAVQKVLKEAIKTLQESPTGKENFILALVNDLESCLKKSTNAVEYRNVASHGLHSMIHSHGNQRSCAPTRQFDSADFYCNTSSKTATKVKFSSPSTFTTNNSSNNNNNNNNSN